jgi:hypothetical protein
MMVGMPVRPVMPQRQVYRRLRSLATMELVNVALQAWLWFGLADLPATVANVVGFSMFALRWPIYAGCPRWVRAGPTSPAT